MLGMLANAETGTLFIVILVMASVMMLVLGIRASYNRANDIASVAFMGRADENEVDARELEMNGSLSDRVIMPLARSLTNFGRIFTPTRNLEQMQHELIMSGLANRISLTDFIGLRFLSGAALAAGSFVLFSGMFPFVSAIGFTLCFFLGGLYVPNIWLQKRVSKRQRTVQLALPNALDMMSICIDAGLGFEAALQKVSIQWDTELSEEFRKVISEIRLGVSRVDALRRMSDRTNVPDVTSFVAVLAQADQLGIAIRDVLASQADQMRVKRRQRAQEAAQKAPLKMLFPLVFFVFPAMFAVILGPALPSLAKVF